MPAYSVLESQVRRQRAYRNMRVRFMIIDSIYLIAMALFVCGVVVAVDVMVNDPVVQAQ